jgi:hypothetical protein
MKESRLLDELGHPHEKPSGRNSQWQRCTKKRKTNGHEVFHEHDVRKKVASGTSLVNAQALIDYASPTITERMKPKVFKLDAKEAVTYTRQRPTPKIATRLYF